MTWTHKASECAATSGYSFHQAVYPEGVDVALLVGGVQTGPRDVTENHLEIIIVPSRGSSLNPIG